MDWRMSNGCNGLFQVSVNRGNLQQPGQSSLGGGHEWTSQVHSHYFISHIYSMFIHIFWIGPDPFMKEGGPPPPFHFFCSNFFLICSQKIMAPPFGKFPKVHGVWSALTEIFEYQLTIEHMFSKDKGNLLNYLLPRFLPPDYADGISAARASITGYPLPSPRAISAHLHKVIITINHISVVLVLSLPLWYSAFLYMSIFVRPNKLNQ